MLECKTGVPLVNCAGTSALILTVPSCSLCWYLLKKQTDYREVGKIRNVRTAEQFNTESTAEDTVSRTSTHTKNKERPK